jgi:hypothetical protein
VTLALDILLRQKGGEDVSKAVQKIDRSVDGLNKSFEHQAQVNQRLAASRRAADASFNKQLDSIQQAQRVERDYIEALEREAKAQKEVAEQANRANKARAGGGRGSVPPDQLREFQRLSGDTAGDASTALGGLGSAASSVGFRGAGAISAAGDIAALGEEIPRFVAGLANMSKAVIAVTSAAAIYAAGFYFLNKSIQQSAEEVKKAGKAELERLEAIKKTRDELRTLSFDEVSQRIADLETDLANATETRNRRQQELAEQLGIKTEDAFKGFIEASAALNQINLSDPAASAQSYINSLKELADVTGLSEGEIQAAKKEIDDYNASIKEQAAEIQRLRSEVLAFTQGRAAATGFLSDLEQSAQRTIQTSRDIRTASSEDIRQAVSDANQRLQIARQNREAIADEVTRLQSEWANATGDEAKKLEGEITGLIQATSAYDQQIANESTEIQRLTNNVQGAVIAREREARAIELLSGVREQYIDQVARERDALKKVTDARKALADFEGGLATEELNQRREASINAVYDAQLKAIDSDIERAKAVEKAQQAQQKLSQIETGRAEKLRDANTNYYRQELERLTEFRKAEQRINDDFAREQRRRLEDLNDALSESATDNDVVTFIRTQKEGQKELSRAAEDANVDASRRAEDFNSETTRNQQEHLRQLLDINRDYQQQRIQLTAQGGTVELTLLDQLQAKRAEIIANREASLEQFRASLENEAINRRRQALIANLNAANEEYKRLNDLATSSGRIIGSNFMQSIINGMSQAQQAMKAVSNFGNSIRIPSFAEGGVATRPTFAMVGDKPGYNEAMIPFRANQGLTMGDVAPYMRGGSTGSTIINLYGVTPENIENKIISGVIEAQRRARA